MKREKSLKEQLRDAGFPDPLDSTENMYRDSVKRSAEASNLGNEREAAQYNKMAERMLKLLKQYGRDPS